MEQITWKWREPEFYLISRQTGLVYEGWTKTTDGTDFYKIKPPHAEGPPEDFGWYQHRFVVVSLEEFLAAAVDNAIAGKKYHALKFGGDTLYHDP